ncbi:hypothetical protein [Kutzneria sp. NPDC052558]|uniref:hypothetical protein n=1 Tax=Kutzneria sp. NPDC052558 TaxID=3364121 RepID=UPI0037C6C070
MAFWRRSVMIVACAAAIGIGLVGMPQTARAADASVVAAAPAGSEVRPHIDVRPCRTEATPQIVLVLGSGGAICYGGYVGSIPVNSLYATHVVAGGYWGSATCSSGGQQFFKPGDIYSLNCVVVSMKITCPNWACLSGFNASTAEVLGAQERYRDR